MKDCKVTVEYTLKDSKGELLDSSDQMGPLEYIHGYNTLIPGFERAMTGKSAGDSFNLTVPPEDGYGEISDELLYKVPRSQFPEDIEIAIGMEFEADHHQAVIREIDGDTVTVDFNHPLAGETLFFDIKILSVEEASEEEIAEALTPSCGCGHDHGSGHDSCCGCSGCH